MASSRGRDLTISILSDLEQFETERAARELEDLGSQAEEAGKELRDLADDADKVARDLKDATDETEKSERGLEDLGDAAEKAGRDLKDIGDDADRVEKDLRDLGDAGDKAGQEFKDTAEKIDSAFDKIAQSSRSNLRKVDDAADTAGKNMGDFKDEVDQVGREASTSFTGDMEDISDALRDVSANALAAFGPAGAIVGMAAAAALGGLISSLQNAAEAANEAKENTADLSQEIIDAGGALEDIDFEGRMQDWSFAIADNVSWWELWQKEATTNIEEVQQATDKAKESTSEFLGVLTGGDIEASQKYLADMESGLASVNEQLEDSGDLSRDEIDNLHYRRIGYEELIPMIKEHVTQLEQADDAARLWIEAQEDITEAEVQTAKKLLESQESFGKYRHEVKATADELELAAGIYNDLNGELDGHALAVEEAARRAAVANGDSASKWQEYSSTAVVSLDDIEAAMNDQLAAVEDFNSNMDALAKAGGQAYIDAAYEMANEYNIPVTQMAQMLVDEPESRRSEIVGLHEQIGRASGESQQRGVAQGMANQRATVRSEAVRIHDDVEGVLSQDITMPTRVANVPDYEAALVRRNAQNALGTITIPTRLGTPGNYSSIGRRTWL